MKILDIIKENDELIMEVDQGLKPEERLGSRLGKWFKKKFTTDPIADKFQASSQRNRRGGGTIASTTPTPMDAGEFAGTTPTPMDAGEFAGTSQPSQLAKPKKDLDSIVFPSDKKLAQQKLDKYDDRAMRLARQNKGGKEAFADPSTLRDTVKVGQPDRARGARGQDMTRANAVAQADAKFKANTPVAKTSKYPKGDIRNLGKYFKPAKVTNQGGKKMAGDVEPQKKGADLRNLLKLAGVKQQPRSDDDRK